ncbi:IS1-like element transposase [Enterobacter kobei]|uniref:IS1-like element transposase n=1 Tax=Enterobacter kobei TaxID=208224 RepID=UPI00389104E3
MASISISCPSCSATEGVVRNGKSTAGHQRYLCSHCRKTWQLQFTYTASQPGTHQKIIDMAMNGVGCRASARIMGVGLNTILRHLKTQAAVGKTHAYNRAVTSLFARKWTNSGVTSALNHASAGCFTRMTGYGGRLWRTYSVNARWPRWSVF